MALTTGRGLAYMFSNAYENAILDFNHAIELNPVHDGSYSGRGLSYWKLGEIVEAKSDFSRAIAFNPKLVVAFFYRGLANGRFR